MAGEEEGERNKSIRGRNWKENDAMKCPICGETSLHLTDHECEPMMAKEKPLCPSDAAACSPQLATKIATKLFTNGFGDEGTRLDIRKSVEMVEHSIGGWCYNAVVDQIEKAILEQNVQMQATPESKPKTAPQEEAGGDCYARLVSRWVDTARRVEDQFGLLDQALPSHPESPFKAAMWGMFDAYTQTLAEILGDKDGWLEWFAWECDFGKSPKEMQFSDGETLLVVGVSDLLASIRTDDDGRRVWHSSANIETQQPRNEASGYE